MKSPHNPFANRLAVCSWSLQPKDPEDLIEQVKATGLHRIQLALDPIRDEPDRWMPVLELTRKNNIGIASAMFGCVGEDYSSLESIRLTGGLTPDATWDQNWKFIQQHAGFLHRIGITLVTVHAGFLPHDEKDPKYAVMLERLGLVADVLGSRRVDVAFETGQETAETLRAFLRNLRRPNVGVNFDPANMILYDKGDPIEALYALGSWVKQVHIKDAVRTKVPGQWGQEVPVGTGEVDWAAFFEALTRVRFGGYCCIEREAGTQRVEDIATARKFVEALPHSPK